ncbi:MAG: hypothetical protein NTZ95_06840 [Candidatus Omnitrophica bacterium]|nr:hypothetical protein [Candidatus Omnitrophota bacterium]
MSQQDPDRQPVEGLNNVILSVPEKSVTSPQIQIESVRKPVAVKSAPDRNAVLTGLKRMQRMFAAYEDILSDHGRMIASAVDEAVAAVETNPSDFVLARGQELISLMPDPQRLDLDKDGDKNWMKWFSIPSIIKDVDVIGRGCRQACLHCLMKNMGGCEERDPLPIVIEKLKRHEGKFFSGWLGNDPLDWRDPFFNVGIDAIVELAQRSRPDLHFTFTTRGWDVDDLHAQATAERLASLLGKNPDNFLRLSFHLLRSRYDLVADIFYNNGKVSEELIEAYARRYANIIRTLNGNISQVFLSFIPDFEPYNVAAREVFMRALGYAGFDAEAVKTAGKIIAEKQSGEVTSGARHFELTASNAIVHSGRGADLFYRLRLALQGDRDCLEPIYSYEMSDDKSKRPWPVVVVTDKGQVSVARRRGTFASTLDELDPMIPLMSPAVSAPEPATQAHESGMIEQETITLPFEQFLEMKKKRVTPTQIVENVQIPNVNFDLPDQIDTPETACKAIFDHEINIRRFLGVASLLRKKYPYGLTKDISKRPLQYAIDENIVYPLGSGLFMTPITESFRRHIIFKKRTDGSVAFAFEVLIPGEMRHKKKLIIDKRRSIAEEILSAFPGRRYCEKPIFWKRIPNGSYELYGERSEFNDAQPLSVMAFEYTEDGKRLDFVSSKTLDFISVEAGIPRGQIDEHIARQAGELTAAVHGLGYIGHEQFKVEALAHVRAGVYELKQGTFNNVELQASNFRIIWGRGFVRLKLVGDFEGYTKADKFRDPEYRRKKDLQLIIEGEDREMRGLKDILRIDSSSLYTIFYEEYKKRGIGFLLPLNKNRDSDQLPAPPADQIDPRLEQPVDGDVPLEKEEQLARLAASARVAADLSAEASRSPIVIEKADRVVPNGPSPSKNGTKYDRIIRHVYSMLSRHFKTEEIESFNLHALEWREEKVSINYLFRNMPNARSAYSDYQDWVNKGRNKENSDWFILLEKYLTRDCSKAPPIVVVLDKNGTRLLEGVRRVVAAKVRGDTAVNAYIGEPPPSVGYKKSAAIPERGIPQPQIDPAPDAMDGWRMETHSDGMSREDMAAGAATEAIDSGTVINIIKEMLTIGYHNGHLMDYMDQINAEKILRLSDRVRSLILVKSQKKSYILEHTVLKGGSKAEGARGIIKNGFDWSRFSRTRTCGAGRGIWTRIIKEDESMIYNDFDPHTIKIRFEGNVLDEKDAKVIAWEIRRLLGGGILGDCPSELWADDLSHDIFDLIMRVNGVDAIFVRKAATMEAIVIKNQKAITIEPSSRSAAVSADAPAIPGAVGGAFDFKQIFSDHDWADRYLDILRRNFSRGGSVKGLCFISSAVLGLWMQDGALKMEMLTDANRYEAFLKGPACFEIKMGYHLNKATGAKDPHHWIVITEKGKTYFFDAIYNAEWGYGGDKLIFEEILSEDNIERKYGLFEFRAAAEDYDTSRVGIDELQMFRYEEAVNAKWDILKKGTKSLKTILDNPRYGSRMRPALAELSEKITAPVLHELSSAERKEIEWFREIFHAYKGNGILSFEGLRLLDEAAVSIKSSHKNLSCIRILEVADYFRRIPDMTGDQVRAGFPQKYFKEIDMLPFDSERYLTTMLLDGCHNQCPWCPVHKTARMVAMPYPLLIMMSMKDSMCRFLNTTLYEPLYYRDICGASMYDVLKLDEVRSSILTHGSMEDHDELADWNIERINKSGKQCIFNISLDFAGADYSKKFSMVEDVDFIAEYYFHRSLNFIRKVDRHTVAVTFGYPPDICSDDNNDIRKWRQIVPKVRAMLENALRAEGYIINGDIRKYKKVISFNDMRYQALSQRALQYMDTGMAPETIARAVEKNMFSETHYLVRPDGSVAISLPPSYIKPSILPGGFTDAMRERFIDALVNKDNFLLTLEPYLSVLGAYTYKVHREEWPLFPFDSDKPGSHRAYSERAVDRIIKWDFPVPVKCIVDKKGITDLIAAGAIKLNYHEVALGSIYRPEKQKVAIPVAAGTSGALPASTVPKQYPAFDMVEVIPAREAREVIQAETLANRIKIYASEAKREKAKVIIGIETAGWVPDEQKSDMHALTRGVKQFVDTLNRRGVLDNITVVLGNSETLLTNIANEKPGKSDKIVVLGSEKTLTSDSYMAFDAFKACIDLRELENLDYIRLLEVLTVALNLGLGGETHAASIVSHPDIGIQTIGERIVRLIPSKRIDINEPSKVYRLQIKELAKQA